MRIIALIGVVLFGLVAQLYGQTYYYELAKRVRNDETITDVPGGQFITFMADICYESTNKGIDVGHGTLAKKSANAQFKEYRGDSY